MILCSSSSLNDPHLNLTDLFSDTHTISIKVMDEKDERPKNTFINLNWFEVL